MFRFTSPLYAIYPGPVDGPASVDSTIAALCRAGASLIQYRDTFLDDGRMLTVARRIAQSALRWNVPVLVNDRADIAALAGAAGVHLGQDDLPVEDARRLLGPGAIVGVSVDTAEEARRAAEGGVDYVSLGPAYPTTSKADVPEPRPIELYEQLAGELSIPLVAIGGITAANVTPLARAGVAAVAVISSLYAGSDPGKSAAELIRAFRGGGD